MRIAILSRGPKLYSTKRLLQAAQEHGHEVEVIDILNCSVNINSNTPSLHYCGKELKAIDAIIPRISSASTFYGTAVVRQMEMMGTYCINSSIAINRARDKLRSLQLLTRKGLNMPITSFAGSADDVNDLIEMVGGPPLIVKLLEGTQGVGVVLAETRNAAESVIQAFLGLKANIIIQEYVKESKGVDLRCIVLGDKVVASMLRKAPPDEFRSNLHRGGSAEIVKITAAERQAALAAAKAVGLNFAGVDMLRSERGPLILEVNSSPGLEGIEKITNKDIAGMVIKYLEKNAKPITNKTRYHG